MNARTTIHKENIHATGWTAGLNLVWLTLAVSVGQPALADDWPTYQHDLRRSAVSSETLEMQDLRELWTYESAAAPQTAWAGPAKWDAYAHINGLRSMRNYDPVFHVTSVGNSLYFGSSVDDSVYCLNAADGSERWTTCTDGPVRIAPTVANGKVYVGSDDGHAYCLDATNGSLVWKVKPSGDEQLVPSNGKFISLWPCRTGVSVDSGIAYFACALLPWKESFFCAVDAETGSIQGPGLYCKTLQNVTMEGALAASGSKVYVPQGRRAPLVFDRLTGENLGALEGGGGVFVLLTPDRQIFHGPGNKRGWITASNAETKDKIASFDQGNSLVIAGETSFVLRDESLTAIDRKERATRWSIACAYPHALMVAGDTLIAGGDYEIAAFRTSDGKRIWTQRVDGRAYGLAVANGTLYVSTHTGTIHAFRQP